jgi:hypothetical protein
MYVMLTIVSYYVVGSWINSIWDRLEARLGLITALFFGLFVIAALILPLLIPVAVDSIVKRIARRRDEAERNSPQP